MFKFIFDLATEPLGLPIEWYYEWIILAVIGYIAYLIAYEKSRKLVSWRSHLGESGGFILSLDNSNSLFYRYVGYCIWSDLDWQICYGT